MLLSWRTIFYMAVLWKTCINNSTAQDSDSVPEVSYEGMLISKLLSKNYLNIRPSSCSKCDDATKVNVSINIIQILGFKESDESVQLSSWFTLRWFDYRIKWNPIDYGNKTLINIPRASDVWIPDIGISNSREASQLDFSQFRPRLRVSQDGTITWLQGIIIDMTCPLDISSFPFDTQVCHIIVSPWQSQIDQVRIIPRHNAVDNEYLPNSNVSEWLIIDMSQELLKYNSTDGETYQYINFSVKMRRQPLYFVILVIIPFCILSFLACLIFTLKEASDRLSVALSILLSMTMYVVIVSSNTPRSMRTLPALCVYLLSQLVLLSVAVIWAVIFGNVENSYSAERKRYSMARLEILKGYVANVNRSIKNNCGTSDNLKETKSKTDQINQETESPESLENESNRDRRRLRRTYRRKVFGGRETKHLMDMIGLVLYLFVTILNGLICLVFLPQ